MTTTPITVERLREIEMLCEAATPGPWRQDCQIRVVAGPDSNPTDIIDYDHALHGEPPGASELADLAFVAASRAAIPELLAEVARLHQELAREVIKGDDLQSELDHATAHDGDHLSKASRRMVDTVIGDRDALRLEVTRLRTEIGEAKLVLEQQDRDFSQQRASIAALQAGHAEMRRGCEEWRAECDERDSRIAALEAQRVDDVAVWHATESDLAHNRRRADEAERELEAERARVGQLTETARAASENWMSACRQRDKARAGLREAIDRWGTHDGETIGRLRALAYGVDFKETT